MKLNELYKKIKKSCKIHSVNSDGVIQFDDDATEQERINAQAIADDYVSNCVFYNCQENCLEQIPFIWKTTVNEGFTYGENVFDMDDGTLSIVGSRLALSTSLTDMTTAQLTFYNASRVAVTFADKAAFTTFCQALINERNRLDQKRVSLKAQVKACSSQAEVELIDITTGWEI